MISRTLKFKNRYISTQNFSHRMFDKPCAAELFKKRVYKTPRSRALENLTIKNGLKHKIFNARRDYYKGEWKEDLRDGWGLYLGNDKNKSLYEGHWKKHRPDGFGIYSVAPNDSPYKTVISGTWKNGKPHGFVYSFKNSSYYEGTFADGKKDGQGRIWYKNGEFYQGMWKEGKKHGFENGNRYEGEWHQGVKQGEGVLYHFKTGQVQEGIWINDVCVSSWMRDMQSRQSADDPTPYPIPDLGLKDWKDVYCKEYENHVSKLMEKTRKTTLVESFDEDCRLCICQLYDKKCK